MTNKERKKNELSNEKQGMIKNLKEIFLAGGCFWGIEAYFSKINGIIETKVGYGNGESVNPTYEEVCTLDTGHVEAVKVTYDREIISLQRILEEFFKIINPISLNSQGWDIGKQYRTGIYYSDEKDLAIINYVLKNEQRNYSTEIVTEIEPMNIFYEAEEIHQKYLEKNPGGYCHVDLSLIPEDILEIKNITTELSEDYSFNDCYNEKFTTEKKETLLRNLSLEEYEVTQNNATEAPFSGKYNFHDDEGIYVDIVSGEPLFTSLDKFDSGCGWPSFTKPIAEDKIIENVDTSYGMIRIELKSKIAKSHLGHVFDDGAKEIGGRRYCINSASLRFIPVSELEKEGYSEYLSLFKN